MYTVVLLTAITAGSATPDFGRHRASQGYSYASCYGSCYGCAGGCYGGTSCYGSCYGCSGGCYGSCSGAVSGCSGCQGSSCHGCHGSAASTYGCTGGAGCTGCHGCYGGHSCYGMSTSPAPHHASVIIETKKAMPKVETPKTNPQATDDDDETVQYVRAQLVLDLPADAKLFVDGQLMKSGSGRRVFQTPNLQPGQAYFYDIRVEIVRNGQILSDSQRVILQPGQQAAASFAHLERQADATATVQTGGR